MATTSRSEHLHPPIPPFFTGFLDRHGGHRIYFELSGNPNGTPVTFLHGGPGSGCTEDHRRYFDACNQLIVLFDQRGSGRSEPNACLIDNTTSHLVEDIAALLDHLSIGSIGIAGSSWGATLGLAFAQSHPGRVRFLALTGVYLGTDHETAWWYSEDGVARFFPEAYEQFLAGTAIRSRDWRALVRSYLCAMEADRLNVLSGALPFGSQGVPLEQLRKSPIYRWTEFELAMSYMNISERQVADAIMSKGIKYLMSHSLIEAHYFVSSCFLEPDQLLRGVGTMQHLPVHIVQSSYDMICPPRSARLLHKALPHSKFERVSNSGHALNSLSQGPFVRAIAGLLERCDD